MKLKLVMLLAGFLAGQTIVGFAQPSAGCPPRPNVLFICVDDLKPVLGCYGDRKVQSPNIDRLAARGMTFQKAYCNQAVCAPSRNSLLTGSRSTTLGIYDLGTNFRAAVPDTVTLPQLFKQNGYRTEAIGKIFHVGHGNHEDPASWSVPHYQAKSIAYVLPGSSAGKGLTREEALFSNQSPAGLQKGAAYESADVADDAYPDGKIAAEAIRRLQGAKAKVGEPFFLALGFVKPHLPFCAPKKYWDLYDRESFPLPERRTPPDGAPNYAPTTWGELRQYSDMPDAGPVTDEQAQTLIHGYYAAISYMDAQVGRVLAELDRLKLAENTIIVLWGDHGWHLGDHGMWCKHSNYEEATRIPLLVVAPGVTKTNTRTSALVETVDIYPTLSELAGLSASSAPQTFDGRSFVPTLRDPSAATKEAVFHSYPRSPRGKGEIIGRGVRTARYRLVEWKKPDAPADTADLELYDYEADPLETKNLAATQPEVVAQLRAILATQPEAKPQIRGGAKKTYRNPLLPKQQIADPHVIKVGDTYYLYATTHTRGYDAYVSKDLVRWENKGSVFDDPRGGAWAPDVFHNAKGDGKFYLYYTDNAPGHSRQLDKQIGVAVADGPLGPFVDKSVFVTNAIDAHVYQDDDGKLYFYYVDLVGGFKIRAQRMSDPLTLQGDPTVVIHPTELWEKVSGHVTEGPFVLKRNGTYYLMYSGTGADSPNYGIGYATSKSPLGPFEKFRGNPIVSRGGKVLGPGHHCVIEGPDKKLWNIYHQKWNDKTNFTRFLAIDPLWFDDAGVLHGKATRETDEPAP
jgi:iduronate 2-sulfatase